MPVISYTGHNHRNIILISKSDKGALVIVRVENPEKALEVLKDENVTVVSPEEVYRM